MASTPTCWSLLEFTVYSFIVPAARWTGSGLLAFREPQSDEAVPVKRVFQSNAPRPYAGSPCCWGLPSLRSPADLCPTSTRLPVMSLALTPQDPRNPKNSGNISDRLIENRSAAGACGPISWKGGANGTPAFVAWAASYPAGFLM